MNCKILISISIAIFLPICSTAEETSSLEVLIQNLKNGLDGLKANSLQVSEDASLSISEYLKNHNYPIENYEVTTEDGYILTLHRIPSKEDNQPAALFVHGLVCGPLDWVTQGPNTSLALLMADLGYDIWLLGTRGTAASMEHLSLNSSEADYWDFSFHEKGYYDLAASIDFILQTTGLEKIVLIGHSEGTSNSMALTTTRVEYNDKLSLIVMLSPIGYMGNLRSPIPVFLAKHLAAVKILIVDVLKINAIPYTEELSNLIVSVCSIDGFADLCNDVLKLICGDNKNETDLDYLLVFLASKPAGTSAKELLHYGQEIADATFRQYDYGLIENFARYGSTAPPNYNVSLITAPVAAYYASNDLLASLEDVEVLVGQLPNVVDQFLVEYEYFNHLDFLLGKNVKSLVYDRVISIIQKVSPL